MNILTRLREAPYEIVEDLPGITSPKKIDFGDGLFAILKFNGDFQNTKKEVAAYQLAQFIRFKSLVPRTVLREIDSRMASVQQWVDIPKAADSNSYKLQCRGRRDMALLDSLIHNSDRHDNNWLLVGKCVRAIDHGLAFGTTTSWSPYRGFGLSSRHIGICQNLSVQKESLHRHLGNLLQKNEIDSIINQAVQLIEGEYV